MKKEKILIFIPAFNVENKILKVLKKIPKNVFRNYNSKIIIIEDCSVDNTLEVVSKITKNKFNGIKIKFLFLTKFLGLNHF